MRSSQLVTTALLLGVCSIGLWAQENGRADTLRPSGTFRPDIWRSFSYPLEVQAPWIEQQEDFELTLPFLPLPTAATLYPLLMADEGLSKPDLMAPLRLQWAREEKSSVWYSVVGTVELGGVAYLAYRHVKKYGLFK